MVRNPDVSSIIQRLDSMAGWMKSIDGKLKAQNGRIYTNEKEIALVRQRHDIDSKWTRRKLVTIGATAFVAIELLFKYVLK